MSSSLLYSSVTRVEECDESILFCLSRVCPSLVVLCHMSWNVVSLVVFCHMFCSVVS